MAMEPDEGVIKTDPRLLGGICPWNEVMNIDESEIEKFSETLYPIKLTASQDDSNNPLSSIIDGDTETKWSVKGNFAWVVFEFQKPVILQQLRVLFHMKKNEKRLYKFNVFAVTEGDPKDPPYEYTLLKGNLSNENKTVMTYDLKNYFKDPITGETKIDLSNKIMLWFTHTSSKRKRFSIKDIRFFGCYHDTIKEGAIPEPPAQPATLIESTKTTYVNMALDDNNDEDTYDSNGVIYLSEYKHTMESFNYTKNFRPDGMRFDFISSRIGELCPKSCILGFMFKIKGNVKDDISFKTDGERHSDKAPECGRCNDFALAYDGSRARYRMEMEHPIMQPCDQKKIGIGNLRDKWVAVMGVSQELIYKERDMQTGATNERTARRFRIYVDNDPVKPNGALRNEYTKVYEIINYGQFVGSIGKWKDKSLPIINEPLCKNNPTNTIRCDKVTEKTMEYKNVFMRGIETEIVMSGGNTNDNPNETEHVKLPPKLVVQPEYSVTQKGQMISVDASGSSSPTSTIDCYYFKQTGIWAHSERLGLKALEEGRLGICEVTYPTLDKKPDHTLEIEVKAVDKDGLEKTTTVKFIDEIDYTGTPEPKPLTAVIAPVQTVYNVTADKLPVKVALTVTASGGKEPLSAEWFSSNEHMTFLLDPRDKFETTLTMSGEGQVGIGCTVTDSEGKKAGATPLNFQLTVTTTPPPQDFDEHGIKMLHKTTGKKVDMEVGSDHRNGQRYNVDHKFKNYMMIGYFKTGKSQDIIEMKTDGPHHSGHTDNIPRNTWSEPDIDLKDGQARVSSEHPHPKNHKSGAFGIKYGNLENKWIGFCVVAYQDGEYRHLEQWCDKDPFDPQGKPKNNWVKGIDVKDTGQIVNIDKDNSGGAKRPIPPDNGEVLEAEIRMNNAESGTSDMKQGWTRVYEIIPPVNP